MDSARHGRIHRPARRTLLRGGAALGLAAMAAAVPAAAATAQPRSRPEWGRPRAEWIPANPANYTVSNRPSSYPVQLVVVHVTQETYADTLAIFQNPARSVSAHYVVRSADGHLAQMVRDKDIGWHAGNWNYNTRSIGIEHEGWVDQPEWFTDAMYRTSAALTAAICAEHGIHVNRTNIIGHHEVPGATHTDPGPLWDWDRYMGLVRAAGARARS
ncbi:N-acetylmuramoyl-L-alanine amidase [Streptomyces sp. N2-109]|uniref:N-acetylmuramoyl-L-alanine amidase n=1 Tax=Streptomyces gossypii TaxID=2883101 RepID=A0ABT2JUI2_9ACTN|nr:N-acetylmuramoyl-L-alanine amidase [Streptomyces gossypii]MCT2591481.1 N-acetylmuramoyl-L-alanine amidase [Streptomyces gossypii]